MVFIQTLFPITKESCPSCYYPVLSMQSLSRNVQSLPCSVLPLSGTVLSVCYNVLSCHYQVLYCHVSTVHDLLCPVAICIVTPLHISLIQYFVLLLSSIVFVIYTMDCNCSNCVVSVALNLSYSTMRKILYCRIQCEYTIQYTTVQLLTFQNVKVG